MRIRRHLSYANVTATLALVIALGGSTAYAVDRVNSHDVVNGSLKSIDLKNHKGVRGIDVKHNSLTGRQINERTLRAGWLAKVNGAETLDCTPPSTIAFVNCASTRLKLEKRSRVLVIATGNEESEGAPAGAACRLSVDGVREPLAVLPGEEGTNNTSGTATNGFARTIVSDSLAPGRHEFALSCRRFFGNVSIDSPTIAAIAIGAR